MGQQCNMLDGVMSTRLLRVVGWPLTDGLYLMLEDKFLQINIIHFCAEVPFVLFKILSLKKEVTMQRR